MKNFTLHPQLAADTIEVTNLPLCKVLLMNDSRYPWLILVPQQDGLVETTHLSQQNQQTLMAEITAASTALQNLFKVDKINIGALGNMVPQLHVHVLGRQKEDPAWPGPVWGHSAATPYTPSQKAKMLEKLQNALGA